jgi:hypothetical protein
MNVHRIQRHRQSLDGIDNLTSVCLAIGLAHARQPAASQIATHQQNYLNVVSQTGIEAFCQGLRLGAGSSQRIMSPIIAHLTIGSVVSGSAAELQVGGDGPATMLIAYVAISLPALVICATGDGQPSAIACLVAGVVEGLR